jgi:hypothetical protein
VCKDHFQGKLLIKKSAVADLDEAFKKESLFSLSTLWQFTTLFHNLESFQLESSIRIA